MDTILSNFIKGVKNTRIGPAQTIHFMKNTAGFQNLCNLTDNHSQYVTSHLNWIIGIPFPRSYKELSKVPMILEANSIEVEVEWFFLAMRKGYEKIQEYLRLKREYESCVLKGEYENAEVILSVIDSEICYSLWSLEQRLLLAELSGGIVENKKFLDELFSDDINFDVKFLAIYYSERIERMGGVPNFSEKMLAAFDEYNGNDKDMLLSYYTFKLDPFGKNFTTQDYLHILQNEFRYSLVDRYNTFVKICCISRSNPNEFDITKYSYRIISIAKKVVDPILENIACIFHKIWMNEFQEDHELVLRAHELYLNGSYEECYLLSEDIIRRQPNQFDAFVLNVKSSIYLDKQMQTNIGNLQIEIWNHVRIIFSKPSDWSTIEGARGALLKIVYMLESFSISTFLINIIALELYGNNLFQISSLLYTSTNSPYFYKAFDNSLALEYIRKQNEKSNNCFTYSYYLNIVENRGVDNLALISNNPVRKGMIEVDYLMTNNKPQEAIEILKKIRGDVKTIGFIYEKILRRLFYCYLQVKEFDLAILCFVETYFESQFLVSKWDVNKLLEINRKNRLKNISATIYVPIFYNNCNADSVEVFNAVRLYFKTLGISKPSEMTQSNEQLNCLIYFLKNVCTVEVLKHSTVFETHNEIQFERIKILHILQELDSSAKSEYEKEILSITRKLIISDGVNKLDESKIYINEDAIYESELKQHEAIFERLHHLVKVYDENDLRESSTTLYSNLPLFPQTVFTPIFNELFVLIKNEFLFNKSGLVNYLSTRIRHGVFESAVRSIFVKYFLVTQRDQSGKRYLENTYWMPILNSKGVSKEKIEKIKIELAEFSNSIDKLILDVLSKKLQIKTESKNKEGLFNYHFNNSTISFDEKLIVDNGDFKKFVFAIYAILWDRTEENLKVIRSYINEELLQSLNSLILTLEENVNRVVRKNVFSEFFIKTSVCKAQLNSELESISNWFVRSNTQMSDLLLSEIIEITYTYLSRSSLDIRLSLIRDLGFDFRIKGQYYVSFTDLLRLFMDNVVKHSFYTEGAVPMTIKSEKEGDCLVLIMTNPIGNNIDIIELNKKIAIQKQEFDNFEKMVNERNSGFLKALNIIKTDFKCNNNTLEYGIDSERQFLVRIKINMHHLVV